MPYSDADFSGGEVFENQYILELLCVIEKNWDKRFPLTFITNGRKLSSELSIFEAVQELQLKYGKQMVVIQVTDDPRFYPEPLTEKQRYRLGKLGAIIDCVPGVGDKCLYPQGRALENFSDSYWNTIAPKCVNARLLAKQGYHTVSDIVTTLMQAGKFCTPTISPDGGIKLGESVLCPSVASIYDSEDSIIKGMLDCKCQNCKYAWERLKSTNARAYSMLVGQAQSIVIMKWVV